MSTRTDRISARKAGPEAMKKAGVKPIPKSMTGPSKGKNGNGRPRTGNKALDIDESGTELGASHAHLDHAYNRFLEGIDEADLHSALAIDTKKKMQGALAMLTHPKYMQLTRRGTGKPGEWSIAAIMKRAGVTLPELMEVYGRYRTSQAIRIAMDRTPKIMTHTADDAENKQVVCPRCDGFGTLDLDSDSNSELQAKKRKLTLVRSCPECTGTGTVTQSGDTEARKLIFEVAGIAGKKGPMVDARQLHIGGGFSVENSIKEMEGWDEPLAQIAAPTAANEVILDAEEVTD